MKEKFFCACCNAPVDGFDIGGADFQIIKDLDIVGMGVRSNKNCKMCPSNDRERMITIYLRDFVLPKIRDKTKLLHIAPEIMLASILVKDKRIEYIKADKFDEGYYYPDTIEMDIRAIEFEDNSIDFVICNHVLEHIDDDIQSMCEIYRILTANGQAILQVPISNVLKKTYEDRRITTKKSRIKYFGQRNHCRIYAWDYLDRLKSVGFSTEVISLTEIYGDKFMKENGLNVNEKIILCRKS